MPDIPDISSMSPDRWLSKMQTVREELLEEFGRIFEETDAAEEAAGEFETLFRDYTVKSETGESKQLLRVEAKSDRVIFEHESGDATVELTPVDESRWGRAGDDDESTPEDVEAHHRELAIRALELIPWWTEGAFARRVGRPRDFLD